jgi:hypothetical protein
LAGGEHFLETGDAALQTRMQVRYGGEAGAGATGDGGGFIYHVEEFVFVVLTVDEFAIDDTETAVLFVAGLAGAGKGG